MVLELPPTLHKMASALYTLSYSRVSMRLMLVISYRSMASKAKSLPQSSGPNTQPQLSFLFLDIFQVNTTLIYRKLIN